MQRRNFIKNIGLFSALSSLSVGKAIAATEAAETNIVTGLVHASGKGIAGVAVSDGYSVALTDKTGKYSLTPHSDAKFIFISIPAGYAFPNENGIARFYALLQKKTTTESIDFALTKLSQKDDQHAFIVWGDTQIQSQEDAVLLQTTAAPDTAATVAALGQLPVHGIAVGDLVFDKFDLFPAYKQAVATTTIPFFQVIGNHDMDYTSMGDDQSANTYHQHFGPTYYSFNRGKIHYVVLDDVFFIGTGHKYIGYITENQLQWLQKDLAFVPKGSTVVVSLHIPTNNREKLRNKAKEDELGGVVSNREALYKILKPYKVHIMSGHTHYNENWQQNDLFEHNHGTVCGAWWTGPICGDGTPAGYGVYMVDGDQISWHYKATGFDKSYQLNVYKKGYLNSRPNDVVINVWNYDTQWKVEWWEDEVYKGSLQPFTDKDPWAIELYQGPQLPIKHKWVEPNVTDHLFACTPTANAKKIKVKVTDRFQQVYEKEMSL